MKKNIRTKFIVRAIVTYALVLVSTLCVAAMENKSAWSQEVSEPGMGLPDDQAARIQELIDSGMSFSDAAVIMANEFDLDVEHDTPSTNSTTTNTQSETNSTTPIDKQTTKKTNVETADKKTTSESQTKPAKDYAHDFDAITDEAKDNFVHFAKDGTPDSMYLNIRAESSMNTITGRELNATTSGNEVGTINYVDAEGNVLRTWVFENWKSDDDFYLDLSACLEAYTSEELVAAYKVSLQDVTLPEGNVVKLKLQSPYADGTVLNIFTEEAGELKETGKTLTVADGHIIFEFTDAISTPVMSPETLIEKTAESVDEATTETSVEEVADTNETETEVAEQTTTEVETKADSGNHTVLIIICLLAIVAAIVGFVLAKKKK